LRSGRLQPHSIPFLPAFVLVVACYALGPILLSENTASLVVLGVAWGAATSFLVPCWMELLALQESPMVLILQLSVAALVSVSASTLLYQLPHEAALIICIVLAALCCACLAKARGNLRKIQGNPGMQDELLSNASSADANPQSANSLNAGSQSASPPNANFPGSPSQGVPSFFEVMKKASPPLFAWGFFELIVGLVNRVAYSGATSFAISPSAPLEGTIVCAILLLAFVFVTSRAPNSMFVYLIVFPLIIGVFMLLPFFGERFGEPMSAIIYGAYVCTSIFGNFLYLRVVRETPSYVSACAITVHASIRIMLVVGLLLGGWFSTLAEGESHMHLSIVATVCVYCLLLAVVYWSFMNARSKQRTVVVVETESFEEARERRLDELTQQYALTPREREVLAGLTQGHTARSMADQMCVSVSTVQSHVKNLHAKLGVSKKQQILELFE
ncbi:MAG: helix-turn-helix transcriptional regulator, partial [Eggerthellaceae bacterium]|nr:helix-turn-helix transcriptional regulator [Eggerthellaceae bacterium]